MKTCLHKLFFWQPFFLFKFGQSYMFRFYFYKNIITLLSENLVQLQLISVNNQLIRQTKSVSLVKFYEKEECLKEKKSHG